MENIQFRPQIASKSSQLNDQQIEIITLLNSHDPTQQRNAYTRLLKIQMPAEKVAFLPFFENASEDYYQLIIKSLFKVIAFPTDTYQNEDLAATAFLRLIKLRKTEQLPGAVKFYIESSIDVENKNKLFTNLKLSNSYIINFSDTDLSGLNLTGSVIRNIKLCNCNLSGTNLTDVDVTDSDLKGAIFSHETIFTGITGFTEKKNRPCIIS